MAMEMTRTFLGPGLPNSIGVLYNLARSSYSGGGGEALRGEVLRGEVGCLRAGGLYRCEVWKDQL